MALNKTLTFDLELKPGGIPPIIHASQGDIGRMFKANIYWDGSAATSYISGATVNLRGRKPDKTVFDYSATLAGSMVTFETTEQMTIISGPVECELVFSQGGDVIASANFVLIVEESPYDPNAISESEVQGINAMIQAATPEAVADWFENDAPTSETFADAVNTATDTYLDENGVVVDYKNIQNLPTKEVNLPTPQDAWIRYTTGEVVASAATRLFVFKGNMPRYIKAFLTSDTNVLCAIAFYNSETIGASSYMQSESVDFPTGDHNSGAWYSAFVPDGCKAIAITTKVPSDTVADYSIQFDVDFSQDRTIEENTFTTNVIDKMYKRTGQYIRYSDGEIIGSGLYFQWHKVKNDGFTKVKATLRSGNTIPAAIAFYTSDTMGADTYIQASSVQAVAGWGDYEAEVPEGCELIVFCTRNDGTGNEVSVQFLNDEMGAYAYFLNDDTSETISELEGKVLTNIWNPFKEDMCFDHLFVNQVTNAFDSDIVIPCQSIFGVQASARLGYKYIEANVRRTYDGKYIVTHGLNGSLGNDFETINGDPAGVVEISQFSYNTLRTQYRYRSTIEKYRVPVTSLEEFCHECKKHGMGVVLQYVDTTELEIARGILGDNIILYNGNRTVWDGYIMDYLSYTNVSDIVARCQSVGAPYMYNMGNPYTFTDAELTEIIDAVHAEGCLIGFVGAYTSETNRTKYIDLGFDFNAAGEQVNDFERGNLIHIACDVNFDELTHNGTVENGVLHLANGQYFEVNASENYLFKVSMRLTFDGTLHKTEIGSGVAMTSDGNNSTWNSRYYNNTAMAYKWVSEGDTYIKNLSVKVSKC